MQHDVENLNSLSLLSTAVKFTTVNLLDTYNSLFYSVKPYALRKLLFSSAQSSVLQQKKAILSSGLLRMLKY